MLKSCTFFCFSLFCEEFEKFNSFLEREGVLCKKALKSAAILLFAKTASPHKSQEFQQVFFAARFLK